MDNVVDLQNQSITLSKILKDNVEKFTKSIIS